ncbi:MAG: sigma-70 family RNA polymerase sigma factor [Phycisphaerae bacterium]|nr:sigma-70 family RNA polymerase sigma factor [Phycisphaerae bacterium]
METYENVSADSIQLARQHLPLAQQIARRLYRRYRWVGMDDLHSYAYLGLSLAARAFDASRGVPFVRYACTKAMYLAIDEMRRDGVLRRADANRRPQDATGMEIDLPDPAARRDHEMLEAREFCTELLRQLGEQDRQLLSMIYVDKMTYKEISRVFRITESAVCLRHKSLLQKLRRKTTVSRLAA